ncbi:MAG: GNAT family N-acetyltransferase, partial [Lentisphaeria bacterium]|nr:GNAT family N-acetyltransferase [Lentisphaeria bacterium]
QLRMLRPDLHGLPAPALPEGCRLRCWQPGDGGHWQRIVAASFGAEPARFCFDRVMRSSPAFRPERVLFLEVDGTPVATASAWYDPAIMPAAGTVHYVGVEPGHQGRHLGYWVTLATLWRMQEEGRRRATLTTDDFRLAAIRTYLRLGFEPLPVHENQRRRWAEVFEALGSPELTLRYADILAGPLWHPPPVEGDDFDYAAMLIRRRRHHPDRVAGRPCFGDCAALGDESLYRPGRLGTAGIDPARVGAGEDRPFEIWFEAGEDGLPCGWEVCFHLSGQTPLGTPVQGSDASRPGFVERIAPPGVNVTCLPALRSCRQPGENGRRVVPARNPWFGFALLDGRLQPGQRVVLRVGAGQGFRWTPLAGRREIQVLVNPGHGEPVRRLPEPVVVTVLPAEAESVEVLAPGSQRPGAPVAVTVRVRDRFDNRVPLAGAVTVLRDDGAKASLPLVEGMARGPAGSMPGGTGIRLRAEVPGLPVSPCALTLRREGAEHGLYFGDLHAHDFTCSAEGTTGAVYHWARDEKRLDFVSVVPQTHAWLDNERWILHRHFAEAFLEEGRFVTFPAFEWQHSHYGDKVIHYLGGDQPYLPVDDPRYAHPAGLYEALRGSDAVVISHHPAYALDLHVPGTDWAAVATDVERLVELWSMHGSSEGYAPDDRPLNPPRRAGGVLEALRSGLRLGFTAGSDTHSGRPGGSAKEPRPYWGGLCAVWASDLTRRSLFAALRARRTYALTGRRLALRFHVAGAPMGAEVPFCAAPVIRVQVQAPAPVARIEVFRHGTPWQNLQPRTEEVDVTFEDALREASFYHARVTLADGSLAVCSPVWVG